MALLKLNRHEYFLDCDTIEIAETGAGRFEVKTTGPDRKFTVIGGRKSGGPLGSGSSIIPSCSVTSTTLYHPRSPQSAPAFTSKGTLL